MFQSTPVTPPQPNTLRYGIDKLFLFKRITRQQYRSVTGVDAPEFDPKLRPKAWLDTTIDPNADDAVPYTVAKYVGNAPGAAVIFLTSREAASLNLPPETTVTDPVTTAALQKPEREIPIRPLLPSEQMDGGNPFNPFEIARTDMAPAAPAYDAPFGASDRLMIQKICAKLGITA